MPIRRLLLENYRAFHERQEIELAPVTVVLGKNNSDKSALVRSPLVIATGFDTPTKGVRPELSLLYIGGQILADLDRPATVSATREALIHRREAEGQEAVATFDWFVLALDLLRTLGAVSLHEDLLVKTPER